MVHTTKVKHRSVRFFEMLPHMREIMRSRRRLIILGMLLILINRLSGLVLPYSNKFLIDEVIAKHQLQLLTWLVIAITAAMVCQGATSFALTKMFATASQELIAELRQKVQEHIGRLNIAYYDAHKCGVLESRIMWDVQGVRNLIGLGMLEFVGGSVTAMVALVILF